MYVFMCDINIRTYVQNIICLCTYIGVSNVSYTVPLDLNFTYARVQKATARNIHGNAPE